MIALAATLIAATLVAGLILAMRAMDQRQRDAGRLAYRLTFPRDVAPDAVLAVIRSLSGLPRAQGLLGVSSLVFEVLSFPGRLEHHLLVPRGQAGFVIEQLRVALPGIRIEELSVQDQKNFRPILKSAKDTSAVAAALELRLTDHQRALRFDAPLGLTAGLLASLRPLHGLEVVRLQWVMTPVIARMPLLPPKAAPPSDWQRLFGSSRTPDQTQLAKSMRDKTSEPLFGGTARVLAMAPDRRRAEHLVWRVMSALGATHAPGVRFRRRWLSDRWVAAHLEHGATPILPAPALVNARELLQLIAWPLGNPSIPELVAGGSRLLPPSREVARFGRVIGEANYPGLERPVALSAADSLQHLHLVGPTGTGKSTLLTHLILQDIAAGRSVVVIEPKGDLIADVLARLPQEREGDVIVLDPGDDDRPLGLNLLGSSVGKSAGSDELMADSLVGIFHRLYASSWGPRTADILHACLLTLAGLPGATICEIPLLLGNASFRRSLTGRLSDPLALGPFWGWYEQLSEAERAAVLGPVMNKLRALLLRRRVRNIIGQAISSFSMEQVLARSQVLLVPLSKGVLGAGAASLLGSLVVARLWQAIQGRAALPLAARRPVFVYIDEFQDYLNLPTDLGEVLAQARGYGVGLTLAHQHLAQLAPSVKAAVLANARSRIVFQTGHDDAAVLARNLSGGLEPTDLLELPRFTAYARLSSNGSIGSACSIRTLPLSEGDPQAAARIRELSRQTYGRDREGVEAAIRARYEQPSVQGGVQRLRRSGEPGIEGRP